MTLLSLLLASMAVVVGTYVIRFIASGYAMRKRMNRLPGPPHSMIWGHLQEMGTQVAELPKRTHPHNVPLRIMKKYQLEPFFYLDLWPFADSMLVVMDPDVSQQLSVEYNTSKHPALPRFLKPLAGENDMVSSNGQAWKKWRSIFNPGFSTAHLMSLVPGIVDDSVIYTEILTEHAKSGDVFRLEETTTRLTIDVIGKVALDVSFNMQRGENICVQALREQVHLLPNEGTVNPLMILNPWNRQKIRKNDQIMKDYIGKLLDERFAGKEILTSRKDRKRTIVDLALDSYLSGEGMEGETAPDSKPRLDEAFRAGAITQIRVFLFAGHDTTSSTICYAMYLLHKHPECMDRIRREHTEVLGPVASSSDAIKNDPYILNKLEYTTAVVKETLRLFPPASAPRMGEPGLFIRDPKTGEQFETEGLLIWLVHQGAHRNPAVWDRPNDFVPERFLPENASKIPEGAWRPFEMGVRNCIGQNLAMLESRIILALICRRFDVEPALDALDQLQHDGSLWAKDPTFRMGKQDIDGEEMYQVLLGAAKPREGMPVRIREAAGVTS